MTDRDLIEIVAALKHDLGKYSSWISAHLDDDAWEGLPSAALMDALQRDLLRTRTLRDGSPESAWAVWERLSQDFERPLPAPELVAVEGAVAALKGAEAALRSEDRAAVGALSASIRAAQQAIRGELLRLHRRLLRAQDPA